MVALAARENGRRLIGRAHERATTTLIYIRVSSDGQAREGPSLDTHVAECWHADLAPSPRSTTHSWWTRCLRAVRWRWPWWVAAAVLDRFGLLLLERVRTSEELNELAAERFDKKTIDAMCRDFRWQPGDLFTLVTCQVTEAQRGTRADFEQDGEGQEGQEGQEDGR